MKRKQEVNTIQNGWTKQIWPPLESSDQVNSERHWRDHLKNCKSDIWSIKIAVILQESYKLII